MILKTEIQVPIFPNGVDYTTPGMPQGFTQVDGQKWASNQINIDLGARMHGFTQITHHDHPGHTRPPLVDRVFTGTIAVFAPSHLQYIVQLIHAIQLSATPMQRAALDDLIDELVNK